MVEDIFSLIKYLIKGVLCLFDKNLEISAYIRGQNIFIINDTDKTIHIEKIQYICKENKNTVDDVRWKKLYIRPKDIEGFMMHISVPFDHTKSTKITKKKASYIIKVFIHPKA